MQQQFWRQTRGIETVTTGGEKQPRWATPSG